MPMSDSMIQSAARLAMYDALTILEAAKELDSNYDVGMHPNTKVEWQALIGSAQANVPAGCIQRHMRSTDKLTREIAAYLRAYEYLRARGEADPRILDAYAMQYGVRQRQHAQI